MSEGLDKVLGNVPVGTGYVEGQVVASGASGAYLRLEAGARVAQRLGVFGFGQYEPRSSSLYGGLGARWTFDL